MVFVKKSYIEYVFQNKSTPSSFSRLRETTQRTNSGLRIIGFFPYRDHFLFDLGFFWVFLGFFGFFSRFFLGFFGFFWVFLGFFWVFYWVFSGFFWGFFKKIRGNGCIFDIFQPKSTYIKTHSLRDNFLSDYRGILLPDYRAR